MIKKMILFLCITTQMIVRSENKSNDIPRNIKKIATILGWDIRKNKDIEQQNLETVQKIKNINNVFMFFALDLAHSRLCEMVGCDQVLLSLRSKEKDKNAFPLLNTNDVVDIGLITVKTIATSEEKSATPLLKKCGREITKTYVGNKMYTICSSYAEPLCKPQAQQLATTIEKELPTEITEALNGLGWTSYDVMKLIGAIILRSSISLVLNTIDNQLCANNTKGKP